MFRLLPQEPEGEARIPARILFPAIGSEAIIICCLMGITCHQELAALWIPSGTILQVAQGQAARCCFLQAAGECSAQGPLPEAPCSLAGERS